MTTADHILKNTSATLTIDFTAGAASGSVTYAVTDAEGAAVASGTASHGTGGVYSFILAPQSSVKSLTIVWSGTWSDVAQSITTYAEVVGDHLFTVADARAYDSGALGNATTYPDTKIRETRAGITDFFEQVCSVSFIPRYGRDVLDNPWHTDLWLTRRQLRSVIATSIDGTALTVGELAEVEVYEAGYLFRLNGWVGGATGRNSIVVSYEHGYRSVPFDIHVAALTYLRFVLVTSDISDRTISWSNELGQFRNALPGAKYPTGIPSVDAALGRYAAGVVFA